jgi:hypothetical protein
MRVLQQQNQQTVGRRGGEFKEEEGSWRRVYCSSSTSSRERGGRDKSAPQVFDGVDCLLLVAMYALVLN